ncbi:MAG: hypothetical protein HZB47_08430 [Nitrosomonadales bacterium]|nr:hypothetical protein [Nitrosomonadales bacterium]
MDLHLTENPLSAFHSLSRNLNSVEARLAGKIIGVLFAVMLGACARVEAPPETAPAQAAAPAREPASGEAPAALPSPAPAPAMAGEAAPEAQVLTHKKRLYKAKPAAAAMTASAAAAPAPDDEISSYLVKVEANREIKKSIDPGIQSSGQLKVWVGQPKYEPATLTGMSAASATLYTNAPALSAKIAPSFPDDPSAFSVEPDTSKCQAIEPTGSTVLFKIIPNKTGQFRVGATVELYKSPACAGDAATKTAEPITVKVVTSVETLPLMEEAWRAFMNFYKEILAAFFATLVIVFRKQLAKLFHLGEKT